MLRPESVDGPYPNKRMRRLNGYFAVSDYLNALHYFEGQQIEFVETSFAETIGMRKAIARTLRAKYPWAPLGQLPHGLVWGYLADSVPGRVWESAISAEQFCKEAKQLNELVFVFESARINAFKVNPRTLPDSLILSDLFAFGNGSFNTVYFMNHESSRIAVVDKAEVATPLEIRNYRTKFVGRMYNPSSTDQAEALLDSFGASYTMLDRKESARIRRRLNRKLTKKLDYYPQRALAQGDPLDYIWSYLPTDQAIGKYKEKAAHFLCRGYTELLLLFEDRKIPAFVVDASSLVRMSHELKDAYILDWPDTEWMLALADEDLWPTRFVWFDVEPFDDRHEIR